MQSGRELCVCADDFGMSKGINIAAMSLADAGQITAIGCMVGRAAWPNDRRWMRGLDADRIDLGLHLDLSTPHHAHQEEKGLLPLIACSYAGLLRRDNMRRQIQQQLTRFEDDVGRAPTFVDGHRHVHQLPVVRELLVEEIVRRYGASLPWLRSTQPGVPGWGKGELIHALGGEALKRLAFDRGIPMSHALLGVYDLSPSSDYLALLATWRAQCVTGDVLMCHPSLSGGNDAPHATARLLEYTALRRFDWSAGPDGDRVRLTPLSRLFSRGANGLIASPSRSAPDRQGRSLEGPEPTGNIGPKGNKE